MRLHKNNNWYVIVLAMILISIAMLMISSLSYTIDIFSKNNSYSNIEEKAIDEINNQYLLFKNILIYTNTNGNWYKTSDLNKVDENNDDDDFNWTKFDTDWTKDDDGEVFKYKFGVLLPWETKNILFINDKYKKYSWIVNNTLSWFQIFSDNSFKLDLIIFDWIFYRQNNVLKIKNTNKYELKSWENKIMLSSSIDNDDLIWLFIENQWNILSSYKIWWLRIDWTIVDYFTPIINKNKNIDYYSNLLEIDGNSNYIPYEKYYFDILTNWKMPIAPNYLHVKNSSWSTLTLEWDINDIYNTWSYYLYRWIDKYVDCSEEYFYQKIPDWYKNDSVNIINENGSFYYTICASNSSWTGIWITGIWTLSKKTNYLQIIN